MQNFDYDKFRKAPLPTEVEILSCWSEDHKKPLVTFLCTTYNHEGYIEDALRGFLIQKTKFPFEILVHDDASKDQTALIVRKYQDQYPNIIKSILQAENQYSQGKRVMLSVVERAAGKYIAICEGDDFWVDPDKIQIQVSYLESNPEYVITYADIQPFDIDGDLELDYGGAKKDLSSTELQLAACISTATTCFRNIVKNPPESAVAKYGDRFLWSMLGEYGKGKYLGAIKPIRYRVHSNGVHSMRSKNIRSEMDLLTYSALLAYHRRNNNHKVADYFKMRMIREYFRFFNIVEIFKLIIARLNLKYI